jgi:hypothetical protein
MFLFLLIACNANSVDLPESCETACALLYDTNGDAAQTCEPNNQMSADGCADVCAQADGSADRWRVEQRDAWVECVASYRDAILQDADTYGSVDAEECTAAVSECGEMPCEYASTSASGVTCTENETD